MRVKKFLRLGLHRRVPQNLARLLFALVLFALTTGADESSLGARGPVDLFVGDVLEGRKVFVLKGCVRCHSVWGEGGKVGPELTQAARNRSLFQLAGEFWNHSPRMMETIQKGGTAIPVFRADEMSNLVTYLFFLNYFDEPGDFARGEQLFRSKGCIKCHSAGEQGGEVGPALDKYSQFMSSVYLAQGIWNHGPKMTEKMREFKIPRPTYAPGEMADILAYIRGISLVAKEPVYSPPGDPRSGKTLFSEKGCIKCHSIFGVGGKVGPDLGKAKLNEPVSAVAGRMWNHGDKMWPKMAELNISQPKFKGSEMADVIAYLYQVGYSGTSGDPQIGEAVFTKKQCVKCHSLGDAPAEIGPNLTQSTTFDSPINLLTGIWNHAFKMKEYMQIIGVRWPRFEGNEMADLVSYISRMKKAAPAAQPPSVK